MRKLILAVASLCAVALMVPPVEARNKPIPNDISRSPAQTYVGCSVLTLMDITLGATCFKTQTKKVSASGKAQVTIHKPEGGKCANGNTYRIMRVSDVRSVCKNSYKHGRAVPACANISGRNGSAHTLIIVDKRGSHLAHEIRHACDVRWTH